MGVAFLQRIAEQTSQIYLEAMLAPATLQPMFAGLRSQQPQERPQEV